MPGFRDLFRRQAEQEQRIPDERLPNEQPVPPADNYNELVHQLIYNPDPVPGAQAAPEQQLHLNDNEQAEVNAAVDYFAQQGNIPANPANQIHFARYDGPLDNPPAFQAHDPVLGWQGPPIYGGMNAQWQVPQPVPWEIRQQIFPQAIETRLSKDDIEKIAQRLLILIEEREAE